jgi:hypothetical protein
MKLQKHKWIDGKIIMPRGMDGHVIMTFKQCKICRYRKNMKLE